MMNFEQKRVSKRKRVSGDESGKEDNLITVSRYLPQFSFNLTIIFRG